MVSIHFALMARLKIFHLGFAQWSRHLLVLIVIVTQRSETCSPIRLCFAMNFSLLYEDRYITMTIVTKPLLVGSHSSTVLVSTK